MDTRTLSELKKEIREFLQAARVKEGILFGSRARGDALETSDVDLLIISDQFEGESMPRRMIRLQSLWKLPSYLECLPYTPEEFERIKNSSGVIQAALREGIRITAD